MSFSYPVNARVTQPFKANPAPHQPAGHTGMDFGVPVGTDVKAIGDGTVLYANWGSKLMNRSAHKRWFLNAGAGIVVVIDHGWLISVSAHLSKTKLRRGSRVRKGQVIGQSGNTGFSTGPHLHFEVFKDPLSPTVNWLADRLNPTLFISKAPVLAKNERIVGPANLNQRNKATTRKSKIVREIPAGSTEVFEGYVHGQKLTIDGITTDLWYVDDIGFVWAGGFTKQSTRGLKNLTPTKKPVPSKDVLDPNERKMGAANGWQREAPNTDKGTARIRLIEGGTVEVFTGYVLGEMLDLGGVKSNIWYADKKGYAWAGLFTRQSTRGLERLEYKEPKKPEEDEPAGEPIVQEPPYVFVSEWECVDETVPANTYNMQHGHFPAEPEGAVIHQFDAVELGPTLAGVEDWFQQYRPENPSSAHFGAEETAFKAFVDTVDRAFHAGAVGNELIGIETDPDQTPGTIESVKKFLREWRDKKGYKLKLFEHNEIPGNATECGIAINLADYEIDPEPTQPPLKDADTVLRKIFDLLSNYFNK